MMRWSSLTFVVTVALPAAHGVLTPEQCASYDAAGNLASASITMDAVDAALLAGGQFTRVVRGEMR